MVIMIVIKKTVLSLVPRLSTWCCPLQVCVTDIGRVTVRGAGNYQSISANPTRAAANPLSLLPLVDGTDRRTPYCYIDGIRCSPLEAGSPGSISNSVNTCWSFYSDTGLASYPTES